MKIKIANGQTVDEELVVEVKNQLVLKKHCKKCSNCSDYYIPQITDIDDKKYAEETPTILDYNFCCGSCAYEYGISSNIYGDYCINKSKGHVGFYAYKNSTRIHKTTHKDPYLIGFEIEKEDSTYHDELMDSTKGLQLPKGWMCVKDSSLKYKGGFELISPAYNLTKDMDVIKKELKKFEHLINANYSQWCGGHISISKRGYTGNDLALIHKPLLCYFLTLFPARLRNVNIHKYTFATCLEMSKKHKPFHTEGNGRFELRMISAVKSYKQLMRRIKTIHWFLNEEPSFAQTYYAMKNKNGFLRKLYSPVYGYERWNEFISRFNTVSLWFCKGIHDDKISDLMERDEFE